MGAGILPTTIHKNKLYFLFGKENAYADTPGYADFGGGTDNNESYMQTAIREGTEELTGFLGSEEELGKMLKKRGTYNINNDKNYRMHIFFMAYDESLPRYYNNNQRFLQKKLDPKIIEKSKIFEKAEIQWFCVDELLSRKKEFRSYFQKILEKIVAQQAKIFKFIQKKQKPDFYSDTNTNDTDTTTTTTVEDEDEDTSSSSSSEITTSASSSKTPSSSKSSSTRITMTDSSSMDTSETTSSPKTQKIYKNRKSKKNRNKKSRKSRSHKKIEIF